jgi:hypothetical protein
MDERGQFGRNQPLQHVHERPHIMLRDLLFSVHLGRVDGGGGRVQGREELGRSAFARFQMGFYQSDLGLCTIVHRSVL